MKILLVLEVVAALTFSEGVPQQEVKADEEFLTKQMDVLRLLYKIHQPNNFSDQIEIANSYDIKTNIGNYKDPRVVKQFMAHYKNMLPRGKPFSMHYEKHREQAKMLYDLFYCAKDYDTFYKTACWARDHMNEEVFKICFSIAVFHRDDMQGVMLPPAYEVDPYLFFDNDVIEQAQKYWTESAGSNEYHSYVIPVSFTLKNQDDPLLYFTHDVNPNAFNTYFNYYYYQIWINMTHGIPLDRRAEQFYYTYIQIYVRYFLERLSNDLPDVSPFNYTSPIKSAYKSSFKHNNKKRAEDVLVLVHSLVENAKPQSLHHDVPGTEYGADMIDSIMESLNYKSIYRAAYHMYHVIIGYIVDTDHKKGLIPSPLEHPETLLTDPDIYRVWKSVDDFIQEYNRLPCYVHDDLAFEGVKVENVDVGKLYTFFEQYDVSLDMAMYVNNVDQIPNVHVHARQYRLNHKPFTYNIEVSSDKAQDVYVRVFLGPKYDYLGREYDLNQRRHYFVEMDRFPYHVEVGKTMIKRNSSDSNIVAPEREALLEKLKKKFKKYKYIFDQYFLDENYNYCSYGENLMLPKGKKGGQAFTFYVVVTPHVKQDEYDFDSYYYCNVGSDKPLGFPFDRKICSDFYTPNMYFKDVFIFFEED